MKIRAWTLGWLASLALVACATEHSKPAPAGTVTAQMRSGSAELRAYQLVDWIAPDDRNLIVNAVDRSLYRARFKGACAGLRHVDTIAFIVQTPPQIEKYQGVVLPDGRHCVFNSITRLDTAAAGPKEPGHP